MMVFVKSARDSSCDENGGQSPAGSQPPRSAHHHFVRRARPIHRGLAPGMDAALEVAQCLLYGRLQRFEIVRLPGFKVELALFLHRFSPSSARTLASARERCALTVPTFSPVVRAIS